MKFIQKILIVLCIVLLFIAGYVTFIHFAHQESEQRDSDTQSDITVQQPVPYHGDVILLAREISRQEVANRSWPTVEILRINGKSRPEVLATVGKVGEFPSSYLLSTDFKTLYINLESKIETLDITSKKLTDVYRASKSVLGMVLSPDDKKLFVWDQKYASDDQVYSWHIIENGTDTIIKSGVFQNADGYFFPKVWRSDNTITLLEGLGEAARPWYLNVASTELKEVSDNTSFSGLFSPRGSYMLFPQDTVIDACNDFSGDAVSKYSIVDALSGRKVADFGNSSQQVNIIAFSSDESQVMYSLSQARQDRQKCGMTTGSNSYFIKSISSGTTQQISGEKGPSYYLHQWYPTHPVSSVVYSNSSDPEHTTPPLLYLNNEESRYLDSNETFIDAFYQ